MEVEEGSVAGLANVENGERGLESEQGESSERESNVIIERKREKERERRPLPPRAGLHTRWRADGEAAGPPALDGHQPQPQPQPQLPP